MEALVALFIPIAICVVLPVMIVWLVTRARKNETNKRTEIMLKAIESGAAVDANLFGQIGAKSIKERLLNRLVWGCVALVLGVSLAVLGIVQWINWDGMTSNDSFVIPLIFAGIFLSVGIALFIGFFVGRKMLAKEIEAEERALEHK